MQHYIENTHQWLHFHLQSTYNEQSLPFNAVALIFLLKNKILSPLHHLQYQHYLLHSSRWKILYLPLALINYSTWGIMQYVKWIIGFTQLDDTDQHLSLKRFISLSSNYYQFQAMANMSDEIFLARMITSVDLEFQRALHYHDEGYKSNSDYGLPPHITRPVCIYSMFSAEASFNLADYTKARRQLSPYFLTPKCPRGPSFKEGVYHWLTFNETLPLAPTEDWGWPPNSRIRWPCVGWGPSARQQGISLHPGNP